VTLAEEEAARALKRERREVVAAEKAASQPPRLGRHRYEAPPLQVLTSDDLGAGSLRTLKPCFLVAKERFSALQKRGAIEVRKPTMNKRLGRTIEFKTGDRRERAEAMAAEIVDIRKARVKQQRATAAATKAAK
jgi:nucleolar protein 53